MDDAPGDDPLKGAGLRERKKRATRQLISDLATALFAERGFEQVTVDEVAAAANVSKVTVFNYFPRKEDLFFDRTDDTQQLLAKTLQRRGDLPPLEAVHALAVKLMDRRHPATTLSPMVASFWKVIGDSPSLRSRLREIVEELEQDLALQLTASVGAPPHDPTARLLAAILVSTWRVAFREGLEAYRAGRAPAGEQAFREISGRGFAAARAACAGSPYV